MVSCTTSGEGREGFLDVEEIASKSGPGKINVAHAPTRLSFSR